MMGCFAQLLLIEICQANFEAGMIYRVHHLHHTCTGSKAQAMLQAVPGQAAAEVSYKNKLTYRSAPVLSNMRVPQPDACAPDF